MFLTVREYNKHRIWTKDHKIVHVLAVQLHFRESHQEKMVVPHESLLKLFTVFTEWEKTFSEVHSVDCRCSTYSLAVIDLCCASLKLWMLLGIIPVYSHKFLQRCWKMLSFACSHAFMFSQRGRLLCTHLLFSLCLYLALIMSSNHVLPTYLTSLICIYN